MAEMFPRHTMIQPSAAAWSALMAERSDLAAEPLVAGWAEAGYPLVVRRPSARDVSTEIPLGLPLPPSHGKRRIALALQPAGVVRSCPPPLLADAADAAPAGWHDCIRRLLDLDPSTRTFGSLAWQYCTGLPYLAEGSDLDLLWQARAGLEDLLARIDAILRAAPMRIDGEVIGAAGGVQWRELLQGDGQ